MKSVLEKKIIFVCFFPSHFPMRVIGFYPTNLAEFANYMFDQKFEFKPPKT